MRRIRTDSRKRRYGRSSGQIAMLREETLISSPVPEYSRRWRFEMLQKNRGAWDVPFAPRSLYRVLSTS
jgi:hypothetical protein